MYADSIVSKLLIQSGDRGRAVSCIQVTGTSILDENGDPRTEFTITNLSDDILEVLREKGVVWIPPLEEQRGVRPNTMSRAIEVIRLNPVTEMFKGKHNRPGYVRGNTAQLFTIVDNKWDELIFEGMIVGTETDIFSPPFIPTERRRELHDVV